MVSGTFGKVGVVSVMLINWVPVSKRPHCLDGLFVRGDRVRAGLLGGIPAAGQVESRRGQRMMWPTCQQLWMLLFTKYGSITELLLCMYPVLTAVWVLGYVVQSPACPRDGGEGERTGKGMEQRGRIHSAS